MRQLLIAAALLITALGPIPALAWLAGPGACHSTRVHTIEHHQKVCADCLVSLGRMTPDGLTVTVYDFGLPTHDLWNWQTFDGRDWTERPLALRAGVMANEDRHFSALPLSSQPLGALRGPQATLDKRVRLTGLRPDHHYTLIIYSPELAGVGGRGGHTAPFERRCFRSARVPDP